MPMRIQQRAQQRAHMRIVLDNQHLQRLEGDPDIRRYSPWLRVNSAIRSEPPFAAKPAKWTRPAEIATAGYESLIINPFTNLQWKN